MRAPIVVFVYNRVDKAKTLLESLSANKLADESELYIFSDGPKKEGDEKVQNVRNYLDTFATDAPFKKTTIIKSERNKGLATSVISGVSKVISKYGKVIVVEDDNICALDFLEYMNGALDFYENNSYVWSISGYTHIKPDNYEHDVYAMGRINSYAWATWKRSWESVDWEVSDYQKFKFNIVERAKFNRYGNDSSIMLDAQMAGQISSWAIRFSYAMHKKGMITIYPCISKTKNIGEDGSGTHVAKSKTSIELSAESKPTKFEDVKIDERIVKQFGKAVYRSILTRLKAFILYAVLKVKKRK